MSAGATRRLAGLIRKETVQVFRDPSALLIAFVLPVVLLFLFAYAVSLDIKNIPFAIVAEGNGPATQDLVAAYESNRFLDTRLARDRREVEDALLAGDIKGFIVLPHDLESRLAYNTKAASVQIITDGAQPNTANFANAYARGIYQNWLSERLQANGRNAASTITLEPRYWFNPELESRRVLLPGALAIIMTMIGTLLTALVVAREWERGTMEALMSTSATTVEILLAKLIPYFVLALVTTLACTALCMSLFDLPLRGSLFALIVLSCVFLLPALGQGLMISALARNQFIAAQIALLSAFLPAFLLSGFLFEINSMPVPIQWLSSIVSARWYVEGLQTVFLAGDIWPLLFKDMAILAVMGFVFIGIAIKRSSGTLDS